MAVVTMKQLLDSGVHFGHQTRRWNPKMKRFIFTERNGIYIIDLQQTLTYIDKAYEFVRETVAHGGSVLFIGTKKQAQEAISEQAQRVGMPYVNQRWLGGMLTNFSTVHKRLQRLKELEVIEQTGGTTVMTKKEQLVLSRERIKLDRTLGGIRDMGRVPSAVWIIDTKKEHIAVGEARKLGIPVVAVLDTNCDPDEVDYKIPGNDDAIRSAALLTRVIADAVADGLMARAAAQANAGREADGTDKPEPSGQLGTDEPMPEWERELLEGKPAATATVETASADATDVAPAQPAVETAATGAPAAATDTPAEAPAAPATPAATAATATPAETPAETVASDAAAPETAASSAATEEPAGTPAAQADSDDAAPPAAVPS
ncbi:MAG: 30S ribosomal protein S2 [Geodermatophilaceae bacterium]